MQAPVAPPGEPVRWLVDGMLGRLARYLRFLGYDAEYVPDVEDAELRRRAIAESRVLLTRDRELAARTPGALRITFPELDDQLRELRALYPPLRTEVRFERCTECNGPLQRGPPGGPPASERPTFVCGACGHVYWEGSHTQRIRERIVRVLGARP
jgi:uncharacterized protein with PIN domain